MKNLKNQTLILSGGLGDIGRAIAMELGRRGSKVALGDVLPASGAAAFLKDLRNAGIEACYDRVDVGDFAAVRRWVNKVESGMGVPTLVIPNAAIVTLASCLKISPVQWQREIHVNLGGAFYLAQTAAARLVARKKVGRIVFVGSWAGHAPHPTLPAYSASKAGLRMLMKCLALELGPRGILVNEVAPGYVDAGLSGKIFKKHPALRRRDVKRVPIRKLIMAEEVALQVGHLCDPANRHMTGSVLLMDGGLSLLQA